MKRMQQRRKKRRPAFLKVWERQGSLFDPLYLIASEFESPQLVKSAFRIFLCASRHGLPIIRNSHFSQLFRLKTSHKTRKRRTFVQCFLVLHLFWQHNLERATRLEPATGIPQRACGRGPSREPCRTSILIAAQARQVEAASSFLLTKKQDIQTGCPVQYVLCCQKRCRRTREARELPHSPMYKMKKAAGMTTCHSRCFPHFSIPT